ncbi:MAG: nitroreductase family deazaflavin-dependent oxidoreductase [Acidobacteria bacterium]|nr:MAG: nitroreductase family deazaflavin-dependent oxidoreductase [Acidobacteriota bacterium]
MNVPVNAESSKTQYLYLTTVGRITGEPRQIEIWFTQFNGKFYVLAEHFHETQWVKNIGRNPSVHVRVDDQEFEATARALDEQHDRETWQTAQRLSLEKYGWGDGLPVEIVRDV